MADFVLVIEADPDRRREFLAEAQVAVARQAGLVVGMAEAGALAVAWARGPRSPHDIETADDRLELLLGYALAETGPRITAAHLATPRSAPMQEPRALDGYFVGIAWDDDRGLAVSGDPFGLFPIYHAAGRGMGHARPLVVASTPALAARFCGSRSEPAAFDPTGLAGILLTNGLLGDRTLLAGVRRLSVGHGLRWTSRGGTQEVMTHALTMEPDFQRLDAPSLDGLVDGELRAAIRRHAPTCGTAGLMLSGGLDSRLMAGYLAAEGATDRAVTLGRPEDFEAIAARGVATAAGWSNWTIAEEDDVDTLVAAARRLATTECLTGGLSSLETDAESRHVGRMSPEFWSGFVADDILGGYAARFGRDQVGTRWSAANFFDRINRWGLPPAACGELLSGADGAGIVEMLIADFRRAYDAGPGSPFQQSFRMKLATRVRHHIGSVLHRISFHSWPLLPVLDRRIVHAMFNAPFDHIANRQLEVRLLGRSAPALANVPLDTNSFRLEPVRPAGAGNR
ncbi:MAG: asparagine synthase-related protein, partial [Pirellulales bacterium]